MGIDTNDYWGWREFKLFERYMPNKMMIVVYNNLKKIEKMNLLLDSKGYV